MTASVLAAKSYGPKWLGPGALVLIAFAAVALFAFIGRLVIRFGGYKEAYEPR
jgi:hypothetical protein